MHGLNVYHRRAVESEPFLGLPEVPAHYVLELVVINYHGGVERVERDDEARRERSSVERHEMTVYEISPERLGTFDFVFVGSLLLHLRDPFRQATASALECRA